MSASQTLAETSVRNRPTRQSRAKGGRAPLPRNLFPLSVAIVIAAFTLVPIYVLLSSSFSGQAQAPDFFLSLPKRLTFSSFGAAWGELRSNLLNSVLVTVPSTVLSCFIGAVNGLIFAHYPFKRSNGLFIFIMLGMFIPYIAIIIPLFVALNAVGIQGGVVGLIVTNTIYGIPICTLIFRNFYEGIPSELIEAARVDGAGFFKTFANVILPISGPGFVVALLLQFTAIWNNFLFGFILAGPDGWPAPVALNNMVGNTSVDYSVLMSGALMVALPTGLLYIFLGKFIVQGLTAGALK